MSIFLSIQVALTCKSVLKDNLTKIIIKSGPFKVEAEEAQLPHQVISNCCTAESILTRCIPVCYGKSSLKTSRLSREWWELQNPSQATDSQAYRAPTRHSSHKITSDLWQTLSGDPVTDSLAKEQSTCRPLSSSMALMPVPFCHVAYADAVANNHMGEKMWE